VSRRVTINATQGWQQPWTLGVLPISHRITKAATFEGMADDRGMAREELFAFYERIAAGGAALLFTGSVYVSADGQAYLHQLGAHQEECRGWLERLAKTVQRHRSRLIVQLNHGGSGISAPQMGAERVIDTSTVTVERLQSITNDYAEAARRCLEAGVDGIQIHAAHGYLLANFLNSRKNKRTDRYGGNLANRIRLLMEVYDAIRATVGADYPLVLKIDGCDEAGNSAEVVEIATLLEGVGIDAVEVTNSRGIPPFPISGQFIREYLRFGSGRAYALPIRWVGWAFAPFFAKWLRSRNPFSEGYNLQYARQFKLRLRVPVINCGGLHTIEGINEAIMSQSCDVVSLGRALIANPNLPNQFAHGEHVHPVCTFCTRCVIHMGYAPTECRDRSVVANEK
jgi:2,4-dienoyl-CoA reductase-like NADH-dependent reductase (Old Yellow Enzyme family)